MISSVLPYLFWLSDRTFSHVLAILLYSTVVILSGLSIEWLFRRRGAVMRSCILQLTLAFTFIIFFIALLNNHKTPMVLTVHSPSSFIQTTLIDDTTDAVTSSAKSQSPVITKKHRAPTLVIPSPVISEKTRAIVPDSRAVRSDYAAVDTGVRLHIGFDNKLYALMYLLLPCLWFLMSLFFFLRFVTGALYVTYLRVHSVSAEQNILSVCDEVADLLHICAPPVLRSAKVRRTLLFGVMRPVIMLPKWNYTDEMATREVFLHELAHMKRRDNMWNIACQAARIAIPLQPLLGILTDRITELSDFVCDDFVVRHIPDRKTYARQLIHMADIISNNRFISANSLGIAGKKSQLRKRIERIMSRTHVPVISVRFVQALPVLLSLAVPTVVAGFIDISGDYKKGDRSLPTGEPDYMITEPQDISQHPLIQKNRIDKQTNQSEPPDKAHKHATADKPSQTDNSTPVTVAENTEITRDTRESTISRDFAPSAPQDDRHHLPTQKQSAITTTERETTETFDDYETEYDKFVSTDTSPSFENTDTWPPSPETTEKAENAPEDSVETVYEPYIPATGTYNHPSNSDNGNFEPQQYAGRMTIPVDVPDYGDLPSLLQLFYYDASFSQESPIFSPDGETIVFTGRMGMGIWTVPTEGGTARLIHENNHTYEADGKQRGAYGLLTPLAFSPDGTEIFFHDWSLNAEGHISLGPNSCMNDNPRIRAVNIKTGEARTVLNKAGYGCFTSDGRICIYRKHGDGMNNSWRGIYACNLETGEEWRVAVPGQEACLSADETEVIYTVVTNGASQLKRVPIEGGESEYITSLDEDDICRNPTFPQCTPDGKYVLFIAQYSDWLDTSGFYGSTNGKPREVNYNGLCAMNLETGEITRITPDTDYLIEGVPRISSDGSKIVYSGGEYFGDNYDGPSGVLSKIQIYTFESTETDKVAVSQTERPVGFTLNGNFPNPFNMSTMLKYTIHENGPVSLVIYNSLGQNIRTLLSDDVHAGSHSVMWDGSDDHGSPVSSGVYIARLKMKGKVATHRMTLAK